jgi:hypothetical protein
MDRPPNKILLAVRALAVVSAAGLGAGYVIFAQVNAQRQTAASSDPASTGNRLQIPGPTGTTGIDVEPNANRFEDPSASATRVAVDRLNLTIPRSTPTTVFKILQASSKSGTLVREASAVVATLTAAHPLVYKPMMVPPVVATSSKNGSIAPVIDFAVADLMERVVLPSTPPPVAAAPAPNAVYPTVVNGTSLLNPPMPATTSPVFGPETRDAFRATAARAPNGPPLNPAPHP